jgi:NADP-dependent 3-hydroxy acid dehydrogenase YdfG
LLRFEFSHEDFDYSSLMDTVIVITGASSGIGAAVAQTLAGRGASLALVARREGLLREVAARCGAAALPIVADVTSRDDIRRVVQTTLERFGRIDVWINNAGQGLTRMPSELTDDDIDEMMRVNVKAVVYGIQAVLPHFKARGTGHVINISSMLGRMPFAVFRSAYSGAKHFLNALTAMFRAEVQETHPGIQFSIVSPGVVYTDFGLKARHGGPDSRSIPEGQTPEAVAEVIADVVESRQPDVYTRPGSQQQVAAYYASVGRDAG